MSSASTIIIIHADFTVAGSANPASAPGADAFDAQQAFYALVEDRRPDVIVLDLISDGERGLQTIQAIRSRNSIPILVVHNVDDPLSDDYRVCGAAGCIMAPLNLVALNQAIQRIIRLTAEAKDERPRETSSVSFAGITFRRDRGLLEGSDGSNVRLTTMERDLLSHLSRRAHKVCTRAEITEVLYGAHPPATDRAIDVIINRLRKKMATVSGAGGDGLLRTEFRRGYVFASDVASSRAN